MFWHGASITLGVESNGAVTEVPSGFQEAKYGGVNTAQCNSLAAGWTGMIEAGETSALVSPVSTLTNAGDDELGSAVACPPKTGPGSELV